MIKSLPRSAACSPRHSGISRTGYDVALPVVKAAAGNGIQPVNSPKAVAAASLSSAPRFAAAF
jgi:hypothetical protein